MSYSVIIVTHNSQKFIHKNIECLDAQTYKPDLIVIVDSGSTDLSYLDAYQQRSDIVVITGHKDIGFCRGNNVGMNHVSPHSQFVLFLNPDAFLTPSFGHEACKILNQPQNEKIGALSGPLQGYNIETDRPTGLYDSTGVFRTWYGRWYDRGQGEPIASLSLKAEEVPALCGALLFCRKKALEQVLLRDSEVWDSTFFMYKDDIDLSCRLRQKGWSLLLTPDLIAYHCRGWQTDRRKMPRIYRLMSARNEIRVNSRACWMGVPYSVAKYCAVRILNR